MPLSLCPNDSHFGPGSACRDLDFTLTFQSIILSLVPDGLFLIYALLRLQTLYSSSSKLCASTWRLLIPKIVFSSLIVVSNGVIIMFHYRSLHKEGWPIIALAAASVSLVASTFLLLLIIFEHFKTLAPSTCIILYSGLIKGLFGGVNLRTATIVGVLAAHREIFIVMALSISGSVIVSLLECVEKRRFLKEPYKSYPSRSTFSFISRTLYLDFIPLLWKGSKSKISLNDLRSIPEEQKATYTRESLEGALKTVRPGRAILFRATMKAFGPSLLLPIIPRLLLLVATMIQPLLVNKMVSFISLSQPSSRGWALVGAYVCVYGTMPITTALYWQKVYSVTVQYRAALVGTIYRKALRLAYHQTQTVGTGAASTYMSVDVERVCQGLEWTHELWASLFAIILAIAILYSQASWTAFLPVAVLVFILALTSVLAGNVGEQQATWMKATDKRIKLISSMFSHFIPMKWAAYEEYMERDITALRSQEVKAGKAFCNLAIILSALSNVASPLCMTATLAVYAFLAAHGHVKGPLDPTRMFSITSTILLLTSPVNFLGQQLPMVLAAYASLKRIQDFLQLEEKQDVKAKIHVDSNAPLSLEGSFSWKKDAPPVLHDINLQFPQNALTICIGPVASGKTTMLMSLLGETMPSKGIQLNQHIAYAAQDAFIFPGTIRENILAGRGFDEALYSRVLSACALLYDLTQLPNGDQATLSEKGLTLSGGQRQRIGLARAAYAQASLTLLDDTFSALDAETEAHVFESLFGVNGLLTGRTVLLVTHNVLHITSANWIVVLDQGRISHQGTPLEIQSTGYELESKVKVSRIGSNRQQNKDLNDQGDKVDDKEEEEAVEFELRGRKPYLFYFETGGWYQVIIAMTFLFLWRATVLSSQGYLKEWSENVGRHIGAWIGGYVAFAVLGFIFSLISMGYYLRGMVITSSNKIHKLELKAVLASPSSLFSKVTPGRFLNRFSQDIFTIDFLFPLALLDSLLMTISALGIIIFLIIPAPFLAILVVPLAGLYWLILKFYLGTSKQLQALEAASKTPLYKTFGTTLSGIETIRALKVEGHFQQQSDLYLNLSQGPYFYRFMGRAFLSTALSFITMLVSIALGALAVGLRHRTNAALLGVALSNLASLTNLLSLLLSNWATVENGTIALQRIHEVIELPPEETPEDHTDEYNTFRMNRISIGKDGVWPIIGSVVFENFSMRYQANLPENLRGITFSLEGGKKLGICGRSGAGKSSLLSALVRSCQTTSGRVSIDGVNIANLDMKSLRSSLSIVSQDPFLWHAPLRDNLDPARSCTDDAIWSALQRVGMDEAVSSLPQKLESVLEESSLSRGQRQLLCMARVLLRKRQIVILDEATSSMDRDTDNRIREIIHLDLKDCTVISVAHRISTICDYDFVLVMEEGKVIELGSPQDLLKDLNSAFSRLALSQGIALTGAMD